MFAKNMGTVDRVARVLVALFLAYGAYTGMITGWMATAATIVAVVFIATSIMGSCMLYRVLGVRTCPAQ